MLTKYYLAKKVAMHPRTAGDGHSLTAVRLLLKPISNLM